MIKKLVSTPSSYSLILIRLMVGVVFLSEGIQKFLYPSLRGSGRFEKIGLPEHDFLGAFVGSFEVLSGLLILIGLFSRIAAIPLIIIMIAAINLTKLEILSEKGIWEMLHAARTDWAMLLGNIFILVNGSGKISFDWRIQKNFSNIETSIK